MTLDAAILTSLRAAPWISGADLSIRLGVTRAAIWARIEELRRTGYQIEASPHSGYRLLACPDCIHADDLHSRLGAVRVIGRDIRVFQETTSTSDVLERLARDGVPEGMVVFAETQTRGRGRLGRTWISPSGRGLWFSVLLRPQLRPQAVTRMTVAAAVALSRAIRSELPLRPEIKWPNDLMIHGQKIAGVLTEMSAELDSVRHVGLGIGVNVNQAENEFPPELREAATSLRLALGRTVDRAALASAMLRELDTVYTEVVEGRFPAICSEWSEECTTLGRMVSVGTGPRTITGRAEALDEEGALLVRTDHGRLERVIGGDVTLQKE
ncbi:MAG: biotin--[acetyl-CoA-carboxylase] ligase [Verrucomicrobiales bacterium]|nr:biotin--[acetyl-CoA-carboxylase] ligase [Verrucomicrobiales bacterium]